MLVVSNPGLLVNSKELQKLTALQALFSQELIFSAQNAVTFL